MGSVFGNKSEGPDHAARLGRNGSGSTEDAIAAINYAMKHKKDGVNLRIISASWGSTARSQALEDVIEAAG